MQQQQHDLICVAFIAVTYVGVCLRPLITLGILWILVRWCCMNPLEMFTLSRVYVDILLVVDGQVYYELACV